MPPSELTERQAEILHFIRKQLRHSGMPPTRQDIAEEFGFGSPSAAESHLRAIEAKGYIQIVRGSSRGIRLLESSQSALAYQFELPLIGRIAAGTPIVAPENVEETVTVDPTLFRPRADFLHRVAGQSMQDAGILDGDIVAIHAQEEADNGTIIAAVISERRTSADTITLKRYFRRGHRITLKSENSDPRYKPIEIDLADVDPESQDRPPFRIAGVFAGLIRTRR
jgi:repressor LexA